MGKDWRVVQKFEHRDMYDMNEIEPVVHQDDHFSDNEHEVLLGDCVQVMHEASHDGEGTIIEANLEDLLEIRGKQLAYLKVARMKMRIKMILEANIAVTTVTMAAEITCLEMMMTCRRFHV